MEIDRVILLMKKAGISFASGLSESEIASAEKAWDIRFPPDFRGFLQRALPVSNGWYNWRELQSEAISSANQWPEEGIYTLRHEQNAFWLEEWGSKPAHLEEAFSIARNHIRNAPKLIPLCAHRYMPDEQYENGSPVFSVYQTDIIYYGANLFEYLANEYSHYFRGPGSNLNVSQPVKTIRFWSGLSS